MTGPSATGSPLGPLDGFVLGLHVDEPVPADDLLGLGEGAVAHGGLAPGERHPHPLGAGAQPVEGEQDARLGQLVVVPRPWLRRPRRTGIQSSSEMFGSMNNMNRMAVGPLLLGVSFERWGRPCGPASRPERRTRRRRNRRDRRILAESFFRPEMMSVTHREVHSVPGSAEGPPAPWAGHHGGHDTEEDGVTAHP